MEIERMIVIERPTEEVWDYIADLRNDPQWCDKVRSVEQVEGGGPGPGARYVVMHRPIPMRKAKELAVTIEEFDPPHRMRIREEDEDGVFDVTYELEPAGDGTRLTQRDRIDWKIPRFQQPLAWRLVSRDIASQFAALKRKLEAL
jgi:uncharacterized protein YndB with AHSA1/START domain